MEKIGEMVRIFPYYSRDLKRVTLQAISARRDLAFMSAMYAFALSVMEKAEDPFMIDERSFEMWPDDMGTTSITFSVENLKGGTPDFFLGLKCAEIVIYADGTFKDVKKKEEKKEEKTKKTVRRVEA